MRHTRLFFIGLLTLVDSEKLHLQSSIHIDRRSQQLDKRLLRISKNVYAEINNSSIHETRIVLARACDESCFFKRGPRTGVYRIYEYAR